MRYGADYIPRSAMAIYAHPDDAEFTVAGTIARWTRGGCEVTFVAITSGNSGTHDTRFTRDSLARTREEEARASTRVLGVSRVVFLGHGDGELVPTLALRRELVREIRRYRPEVVMCGDPQALFFENRYINHPDHRAAGQAAIDAAFPCSEMELLWPEEGPAHVVRAVYVSSTLSPNTSIDITDTIDVKIAALREHKSQLGERDPTEMIRAWGMREAEKIPAIAAAGGSVPAGPAGGAAPGVPGRTPRYAESFRVMILKPFPPPSEILAAGHRETAEPLPSALDDFDEISRRAEGKRLAVFLDYDGTLSPIAETPDQAVLPEDAREALAALSRHCPVGILSGRDLEDVRDKVRIDGIAYAGSHGFDIAGPDGLRIGDAVGEEFLPVLDRAEQTLSRLLGPIRGLLVERKTFAVAVHYRRVAPELVERVETVVDEVAAVHPQLRKAHGKKIFELQPRIDWHKGKALLSLLRALDLDREDVLPFYIGDDATDEDAFRALAGRGIGIVVRDRPRETAATYSLKNPDEVRRFLVRLIPRRG